MERKYTKKLNLLLLTDCLAGLVGGAEKQIIELAARLDKDRFNIFAASLDCAGTAPRELVEKTGAKLHVFRVRRIYGLSGLRQGIRFWRFLKNEKIDILMTYHFSSDIWGTILGKLAGVSVIISNRRDMGFWRKRYHARMYKFVNRWVKRIVVNAKAIEKMVITTEGYPAENIQVICNGIDSRATEASPAQIRDELGLNQHDIVIMHIANLKPVKGHSYLLDALAENIKAYPRIKLILIGNDEMNGSLQQQAQERGLASHVVFLGRRDDAAGLLPAADICVLSSLSEGMSNAILEYMLAGKPVVAANVGGNSELVEDGHNGVLVEKCDSRQLAQALEKLIANPDLRARMGKNSFEKVKRDFSIDTMIRSYEALFLSSFPQQKRILHLISSGGLFGAEGVVLSLGRSINKNGLATSIAAFHNAQNPHIEILQEAKKEGIQTFALDSRRFDIGSIFRLKKLLIENRISLLHTHNYKSDIVGYFAAKLTGIPWVATNHVWHGTDRKLRAYEKLDAFFLKFADKIVAVSAEIKRGLIKENIPDKKIEVIHNGIDLSAFNNRPAAAKLRTDLGISHGDFVIVIAGRLSEEKGHEIFLKAAPEVSRRRKGVKFLIVGDGPLKGHLKSYTAAHNLTDQVIFTGIRTDIPDIYSISSILVNASFIEGLPLTILEAMASKLPVIATAVGAVPQVIKHGVNGILIEAGDFMRLSAEICALIDDSQKRELLAEQAYRDACANFNVAIMANSYRELYQKVIRE